jgi:mitotic spindle assembly checkpoint protein MAD2
MGQMEHWLLEGDVQRLVVVVSGVDSGETLERWQFNVSVEEKDASSGGKENVQNAGKPATATKSKVQKSIKEIHDEIQAIIRQITASVSQQDLFTCTRQSDAYAAYSTDLCVVR